MPFYPEDSLSDKIIQYSVIIYALSAKRSLSMFKKVVYLISLNIA